MSATGEFVVSEFRGTSVQEVNQVLMQSMQMRKMIRQFGPGAAKGKLCGLGNFAGLS